MEDTSNNILMIYLFFLTMVALYAYVFSILFKHRDKNFILPTFYKAITTVFNKKLGLEDSYLQLNIDYIKLTQNLNNNPYKSILDILHTIMYHYDSYEDSRFKRIFRLDKDDEIRDFIVSLCFYISKQNPFISVSQKEANLMSTIKEALEHKNKSLGFNALEQLSFDIENMEKSLAKKDKENRIAIIVSIIGIVLTILFGVFSFILK